MDKFYLITVAILLFTVTSAHTPKVNPEFKHQDTTIDDCPEPHSNRLAYFCNGLKDREPLENALADGLVRYKYEANMWEISCASTTKDIEQSKKRVREMWSRYIKRCTCRFDSLSNPVSILKYAIFIGYPDFVFDLVEIYDVDVNFKDQFDGKTVLQYLDDEYLIALKENKPKKAEELKAIKATLVELQNEQKSKN